MIMILITKFAGTGVCEKNTPSEKRISVSAISSREEDISFCEKTLLQRRRYRYQFPLGKISFQAISFCPWIAGRRLT